MSALDDVVSNIKNGVLQLSQINNTLGNAFPRVTGTFKLGATASTVVQQTGVTGSSIILLSPTNAAAATLQANQGIYIAAVSAGSSFTVATGSGSGAGTETFSYAIVT